MNMSLMVGRDERWSFTECLVQAPPPCLLLGGQTYYSVITGPNRAGRCIHCRGWPTAD